MPSLSSYGFSFKIGKISFDEGNKAALNFGHLNHLAYYGLYSGRPVIVEKVEKFQENFKAYDILRSLNDWNVIKILHMEENQSFRYLTV